MNIALTLPVEPIRFHSALGEKAQRQGCMLMFLRFVKLLARRTSVISIHTNGHSRLMLLFPRMTNGVWRP
jgi:hypothetical protein